MKNAIKQFGIQNRWFYATVIVAVIGFSVAGCKEPVGDIPVTFSSVSAGGSATQTTTELTLTFSQAITGLEAGDITMSGVYGVTKGTLSGSGPSYTLPISGFTTGGTLSVAAEKSGYAISGSPKTAAIYYYNVPVSISSVNITITAPVKGATPGITANGTGNFTMGTVSWSPIVNKFLGGTAYTASVTLTANSNYTFTGLTATVNGQNATVSNNTGETATLSYTFPATDTRTVTDIAIKTQPDKLIYTHGDQFDLTGLVATLTYDDTTTEDVAAADFADKNIMANPSHDNHLVHVTHNGHPVTITYGELTPLTTNIITVNPMVITFTVDSIPAQTYTGSPLTPTVTVRDGTTTLTRTADYTVEYTGNTNAGTAAVTITGEGNYAGSSGSKTFIINKAIGAEVSAPSETTSVTHNSITINPVTASTGQTVEYAINTTNSASSSGWQDSTTFSELSAGTTYYIFTRSAENDNYETGAASASLTVTTLQTVSPDRIEYFWVNEHGSLVTTSGGETTVIQGQTLAIILQGTDYDVKQWYLDGVNTGQSGNTYNFLSTAVGKHTVGLFVQKNGRLYNTNITVTVAIPYTVTFDVNDGSGTVPETQTVAAGSSITLPSGSGLTKTGYIFNGWNTNTSGTGTNYNAEASYTPTGNVTLYVKWSTFYSVTFNANDGSSTVPPVQTVAVGSSITLPGDNGLIRIGYNFGGWNTNSFGTGTNNDAGSSYTPTGDITLYAKWNDPIPLTGSWANGSITSSTSAVWYSLNFVAEYETSRYIWWNDSKDGNSTKTLDVKVTAYSGTSMVELFKDRDSGWTSSTGYSWLGNGQTVSILIKVIPYYSGETGTFAITYSYGSTRPW